MSYHVNPGPNATFASTQTQSIVDPTLGQVITFDTTEAASGITLIGNTKITLPQIGRYIFNISAVCHCTSGSNKSIYIWLRYNGVDVPRSNTLVNIASGNEQVLAVAFVLPCATVGDYYEVYMAGDTTNCQIEAKPAVVAPSTPVMPAVPSIVVTVNQVV